MTTILDDHVRAICTNGHLQSLWGSPLVAKDGERVSFWGGPFQCHCGAPVYGGGRFKPQPFVPCTCQQISQNVKGCPLHSYLFKEAT